MSISNYVTEQLKQLAMENSKEAYDIVVNADQLERYLIKVPARYDFPAISLTLADYDRYSVTLCNLKIKHDAPAPTQAVAVNDYLQHRAHLIIKRLSYLLEPLALVEVDAEEGAAQLRSTPTQTEGEEERTYWEVMLRAGENPSISMARYRWQADTADRELIPYPSIFANLGRMAEDLALALLGVELEE